jgi:hypothetical protein
MDSFFPGTLIPLSQENQFALGSIQRRPLRNFAIPISSFLHPIK